MYSIVLNMEQRGSEVRVVVDVYAYFSPRQSWYHKDMADDHLLSHEQLHFDITELYARKLRKKIATYSFTQDADKEMKVLFNRAMKSLVLFKIFMMSKLTILEMIRSNTNGKVILKHN